MHSPSLTWNTAVTMPVAAPTPVPSPAPDLAPEAANTAAGKAVASDAATATKGRTAKAAFSAMLAAMRAATANTAASGAAQARAGAAEAAETGPASAAGSGMARTGQSGDAGGDAGSGMTGTATNDTASLLAMLGSVADTPVPAPEGSAKPPAAPVSPSLPAGFAPLQETPASTLCAAGAARLRSDALAGGSTAPLPRDTTASATPALSHPLDNAAPASGAGTGTGASTTAAAGVLARSAGTAHNAAAGAMAATPAVHTAVATAGAIAVAAAESASARGVTQDGNGSAASPPPAAAPATAVPLPGMMWSAPAATGPLVVTIATPVHSPYFAAETAQQVTWLTTHGIEQARINVTPAELGPIEIRIAIEDGEALINFAVTHPASIAAIEESLPRLREMLAAGGITLGQAAVGDEQSRFDGFAGRAGDGGAGGDAAGRRGKGSAKAQRAAATAAAGTPSGGSLQRASTRLVDLFA